jgi:chemotaxis protein MotB
MHYVPEEKPEGAPEWMVSFADMITIMMSFFVIMFALASGERGKKDERKQAVLESLENRFGPKWQPFSNWGPARGNSTLASAGRPPRVPSPPREDDPRGEMMANRTKNRARIFVPKAGDHAAVGGVVYFQGDALELPPDEQARLATIAAELAGKPQVIEICGHASSRPLAEGTAHRDRWDLAYARCRKAAELLGTLKIEPQRLRFAVHKAGTAPGISQEPPDEDLENRIDVYLTDVLAEGFSPMAAAEVAPSGGVAAR